MTGVTACIVQARMGSTRLPGKVMKDLAGWTVLRHVLTRCTAIPGVDVVVCATVDEPACDGLAAEAEACGALVFRGSESDVLSRYLGAARLVNADIVMRVTSDCPLIDPQVSGETLALMMASGAAYVSNTSAKARWPKGLDTEVFGAAMLEQAAAQATAPHDREHVTPWIIRNPELPKDNYLAPPGLIPGRWTLDHPEDYAFFQALFKHLPPPPHLTGWREIQAVLDAHPEIVAINAHLGV